MFHFKLYDDKRLTEYSVSVKHKIIRTALKLSRKDNPLNIVKRLTILFFAVFLPAFVIFYFFGFDAAVAWAVASTMIVGIKLDSLETPTVEPYLSKAIDIVEKKT